MMLNKCLNKEIPLTLWNLSLSDHCTIINENLCSVKPIDMSLKHNGKDFILRKSLAFCELLLKSIVISNTS